MSLLSSLKVVLLRRRAWRGIRPPVFIVGCGHSGTSLLLSVLGSHSRIHAIPRETNFAYGKPLAIWRSLLSFRRETRGAGKKRWVEKTPRHVHKIALLLGLHPESRVIVIVRDGRDVAASLAKRFGNVKEGAERWIEDNRAALAFRGHPRVLWVKYEEVVGSFEDSVERVTRLIDEVFEPGMKEPHRSRPKSDLHLEKPPDATGANHKRYRQWQLSQPVFDGRGRFRQLPAEELAMVERMQRELLKYFDYPISDGIGPTMRPT